MTEYAQRSGMHRFDGQTVIVTGGASGIGESTAARFLAEGANVVIMDRNPEHIAAARGRLEPLAADGNDRVVMVQGDVTNPGDVDAMVRRALETFGTIDVLINNAGVAYEEPFLDIPLEHWDTTIAVNLRGMFLVGQRVAKEMVRQGRGVILLTSSTNGVLAEDKYAHYNASKGGVTLLARSMAIELGPHGIRVNAVCPGYIVTPLAESIDDPAFMAAYARALPLRYLGKPEDVAALFAFLASEDARFITGEAIVIDGGQLAS